MVGHDRGQFGLQFCGSSVTGAVGEVLVGLRGDWAAAWW